VCVRAHSFFEMNSILKAPQAQESITLYYREGSSDKVYQVSVESAGDLFVVNFSYGRRGTTLNTGSKTSCPVEYDQAKRIYDKLVREKKAKGYTEGPSGAPYQHTDKAGRFTGILPQLLNPVDEPEVNRLADDPAWCFQPKFDGRRLLIQKTGREVTGINRKGLIVSIPECLTLAALLVPGDYLMDGEAVGLVYYAFDLLEINGGGRRLLPMRVRFEQLLRCIPANAHPYLVPAQTAWTGAEKHTLLQSLRRSNQEGVVAKEINASYEPGRPNSGGVALKHKFYATLSAVVTALNAKRSVEVRLVGNNGWQSAGNVTVPPSHLLPKVGTVIDIRYLYAFRESGALYQPVYLGPRSDVDPSECRVAQLKFKAAEAEDES
jgi:bifunctional non-homologous end joining protein LigD